MKILLAPDKFKHALTATQACAAMALGVRQAKPEAEQIACPLADGGEGTGPLLARALQAQEQYSAVLDPLGRERAAHWWYAAENRLAIVEMAEASGLALLTPEERDPLRTTSFGTGQLLRAAMQAGAEHILLGVGGSATVDGGAGCLQGMGWQLVDAAGRVLTQPASGGMLPRVASILPPPRDEIQRHPRIVVLCDVDHPLVGPRGAAPVFAPQKGASPAAVEMLDKSLQIWGRLLEERSSGGHARSMPGGGAAGGLPAGLSVIPATHAVGGFDCVADLLGLDQKLRGCDLCLTGEGRLDEQTAGGKVVAGLARRARAAGVPVVALVGAVAPPPGGSPAQLAERIGVREVIPISPAGLPLEQALSQTAENLRGAVMRYLTG